MNVIFQDMGEVFKAPFRFLPYCPKCNAELGNNETLCQKCGEPLVWGDPYASPFSDVPLPQSSGQDEALEINVAESWLKENVRGCYYSCANIVSLDKLLAAQRAQGRREAAEAYCFELCGSEYDEARRACEKCADRKAILGPDAKESPQ